MQVESGKGYSWPLEAMCWPQGQQRRGLTWMERQLRRAQPWCLFVLVLVHFCNELSESRMTAV